MWAAINHLYKENKLSLQQKSFIDDYNRSGDYIWKYVKDSSLIKLNQKSLIDSTRKYIELYALNMYSLVDQYETTKQYASFVKEDISLWDRRNSKMAENILQYIKSLDGKRIVVLTGLYHKYALLDLLSSKQHECCFEIKEIGESIISH